MRRNPFGVEDVPEPDGDDVTAFAATVRLRGSESDPNALNWADVRGEEHPSIEGRWSSRWKSEGLDWHIGHGDVRLADVPVAYSSCSTGTMVQSTDSLRPTAKAQGSSGGT
jgi:hypothetical protein